MSFGRFIKQNFALCMGLAMPVALVIAFLAVSIIPKSLAIPPQHKIAYVETAYNHRQPQPGNIEAYPMVDTNGRLYLRLTKEKNKVFNNAKLMVTDVATGKTEEIVYNVPTDLRGQSEEIPLAEAKHIHLSTDHTAPDGYSYEEGGYQSSGLAVGLFSGGNGTGDRITKGAVAYKIKQDGKSRRNIDFLGWVMNDSATKQKAE